MRGKTTLFLLLLVIVLGGIILSVERFLPSTRELIEMKKGPLKFEPGKITQIDIDSSGGDGVSLALDSARWWVRRPFNDLADPEKVAKLLKDLTGIGWIQRVHRSEFVDAAAWAKTSLAQPQHKLRLLAGGEVVLECWVGASSAIEGGQYLALLPREGEGEAAYYVAKTTIPELLKTAPKNWRDPKLLRLPANQILGVKLTQPGGQIELSRENEKSSWYFVKPLSTRGSKERIGELLSTLLNLEVKDAVEPLNGNGGKEAAASGGELAAAELRISVTAKGFETPVEITLKKPAKDVTETTATVNNRKPVFTVLSKSLIDLWAQPNDLRDRMLARIDEDEVTQIQVTSDTFPPVILRKESESWFLQRHGKLEPANGDRIARYYDALNTHPILEFTADSASNLALYGLDLPFLTTTWTEGAAKPVKLLIGKNADGTQFFAKYEDEPSVFRIDASLLPSIPPDGIKWKGLGALRFTQFALRRISMSAGTAPPVNLTYDPTTAQWTGKTAERDITPLIDRVKADKRASALAKLNVQDWSADRTDAIQALKTPALRVVVTLGEPGTNTGPTRDVVLNFSPTQAGMDTAFYFGQVEGDPDV
ncbi:MAG: DUF4340 domain-containing protein, partial [Prosthecobacter sp.]|nr:DUF4340 domain-containing protein [Prosthecobacter sp.]